MDLTRQARSERTYRACTLRCNPTLVLLALYSNGSGHQGMSDVCPVLAMDVKTSISWVPERTGITSLNPGCLSLVRLLRPADRGKKGEREKQGQVDVPLGYNRTGLHVRLFASTCCFSSGNGG
jgi:hypothetical protein